MPKSSASMRRKRSRSQRPAPHAKPAPSVIRLSASDSLAVLEALRNPSPPNEALLRAAERYKALLVDEASPTYATLQREH